MSLAELSFGVTGHRNFSSTDVRLGTLVASEIKKAIPAVRPQWSGKGTIVSALAEGADRLVARVGQDQFGFSLVVPLPLPVDAYVQDFASDASKAEFNALLATAMGVIEAPLLSKGEAWRRYTEERNHQYAWGGAYLVAACDVLIALWDGKPARGTGGTAHVVDWFREGEIPAHYGLLPRRAAAGEQPSTRRLVHIVPETGEVRTADVLR